MQKNKATAQVMSVSVWVLLTIVGCGERKVTYAPRDNEIVCDDGTVFTISEALPKYPESDAGKATMNYWLSLRYIHQDIRIPYVVPFTNQHFIAQNEEFLKAKKAIESLEVEVGVDPDAIVFCEKFKSFLEARIGANNQAMSAIYHAAKIAEVNLPNQQTNPQDYHARMPEINREMAVESARVHAVLQNRYGVELPKIQEFGFAIQFQGSSKGKWSTQEN